MMLSTCVPQALEKRVQVWKIAAVASTLCRSAFVLTLAALAMAVLSMPRAVVGDCFIIYTDSAKVGGSFELTKVEGELGEVSMGTEGEKFEATLNTQGQKQAMRQVRMRDEFTASNDNKKVLEFRTGACVNEDDMYVAKMLAKKNTVLRTEQQCWTDGKCFAESLTLDGEECNCQSKAASESCQLKCFNECTTCNCGDLKQEDSDDLHACVQDTFLHQQFAWAEHACEVPCSNATESDECVLCRQKNFIFIDKCAMSNPHVGGNQAVCEGDAAFDIPRFVKEQDIINCTNPEGCQVYNLDDYSEEWMPNGQMPVEAWWDAASRWWSNTPGPDGLYPNVFAKSEDGNAANDLRPIGSSYDGGHPWEQHHYPSSRRLSRKLQPYTHMTGCKWQYGDWESLTAPTWSAGSREFQKELVHRVEVVQSSLGSNPGLDQCQTSGMRVGSDVNDLDLMSLANWNFAEGVLVAMSFTYILCFAMKTYMMRKTWVALTNSLKEMDNSQKETLSSPVSRIEKPGCCSKILGCLIKVETFCEKIQSPFFSVFIILVPAYTLAPLLQATCFDGFIVAPAGDVWVIRAISWPLLGFIIWWFACQIVAQYSQRCKVISQFLNALSLLPFTYVGGQLVYYELLKLGKTGLGFEFALFFKHMFSFSFSVGMEFAVDLLQLLFSVTVFMDVMAGVAGAFTKRDWKEKCIFSYLVKNIKNIEPAKTSAETSV
jgi:hypothetical protein